jgi:hypothetical protein
MEIYIQDLVKNKNKESFTTVIENPVEIKNEIVGSEIWEFIINTGKDAYCNDKEEIHIDFSNGKEMKIFINEQGNLQVYTD